MKPRPLGRTGLSVGPIGLGTVKLGRTEGLKHPGGARLPSDDEARALLRTARDLGITLLDTAPAYGASEERLGALLAGEAKHWVIATKVGEAFEGGRSSFDFSPAGVRASIERSLRRLRVQCLDVVLVHSDGVVERDLESPGTLDALRRAKKDGLVRAIGVSAKTLEGAMLAARLTDVVMLTLSPADRAHEPAIGEAHRLGAGVLVKKALASGRLDRLAEGPEGPTDPGGKTGDPVERTLALALAHPGVSSVVIGTTDADHLRENVGAARRVLARLDRHTGAQASS